ncbi:MAG: hypothetical protein QM777_13035 [Pseudorhodoferax sp.]
MRCFLGRGRCGHGRWRGVDPEAAAVGAQRVQHLLLLALVGEHQHAPNDGRTLQHAVARHRVQHLRVVLQHQDGQHMRGEQAQQQQGGELARHAARPQLHACALTLATKM